MAKRKRTVARRRRRVGAVNSSVVPTLGGAAAGLILGRIVANKFLASMDSKISAAVQIGAGIFLFMQKQPLVKGVGVGLFTNGVAAGAQSLNLIAGVSSGVKSSYLDGYPQDEMQTISGDMRLNYLGNPQGSPDMNVIGGIGNPQGDAQYPVIAGNQYAS